MIDREKVIKGLECCQLAYECEPYKKCPYSNGCDCGDCNINQLHYDALALLKEQPEIVRCRDCIYNDDGDCIIKAGWFPVKPDWFCADGERKS